MVCECVLNVFNSTSIERLSAFVDVLIPSVVVPIAKSIEFPSSEITPPTVL